MFSLVCTRPTNTTTMNNTFFSISAALCAADELKSTIDKMIEESVWASLAFERTEFALAGKNARIKFLYRQQSKRDPFSVTGGPTFAAAMRSIKESDSGIANVDVEFGNEFAERLGSESDDEEHGFCGQLYNTLAVCVDFRESADESPPKRKRSSEKD